MEERKHEELLNRRKDLQIRIAHDKALIPLSEVLAVLDSRSALYQVLWNGQNKFSVWIESLFPVAFARVDWEKLPGAICRNWHTDQERLELVSNCLEKYIHDLENDIIIAWSAGIPAIRTKVRDAYTCLTEILEVDWETWIYDPESNWLIESYHEGEVCSGRSLFIQEA